MTKLVTLVLFMFLFSFGVKAQTEELDKLLNDIEKNNKELISYSSLIESKQLELKSTNNLYNPEASFYYLPFGNNVGAYTEFQISQTMDFPTVYKKRKDLIESQKEQLELDYFVKKQDVLLEAKKYYNELVYLNKYKKVASTRIEQAALIYSQIQNLYTKGQIGILESNKAKIVLLQEQFKLTNIDNEITEAFLLLKNLNGGIEVEISPSLFSSSLDLIALEEIIKEKEQISPNSLLLNKMETIAEQRIKLSQNMGLPNITLGANYQGFSSAYNFGFYGGLSLPLWNNKNKVKASKVNYIYQQAYTNAEELKNYSLIETQYNEYKSNLFKYNEYLKVFEGINSNTLLLKSFELGQISFMEFYIELKFYQQAEDEMLQMEYQLNQLSAEIFKFKL